MKKLILVVLVVACTMALCSCGWNSKKAVATVFSENVSKVDITYHFGAETVKWSVEGTELNLVREWFNCLDYIHIEFAEGQTPGDINGNEVYIFEFYGGEWTGFSYVINGENDCYILNPKGNWFAVINPSNPPAIEATK